VVAHPNDWSCRPVSGDGAASRPGDLAARSVLNIDPHDRDLRPYGHLRIGTKMGSWDGPVQRERVMQSNRGIILVVTRDEYHV